MKMKQMEKYIWANAQEIMIQTHVLFIMLYTFAHKLFKVYEPKKANTNETV